MEGTHSDSEIPMPRSNQCNTVSIGKNHEAKQSSRSSKTDQQFTIPAWRAAPALDSIYRRRQADGEGGEGEGRRRGPIGILSCGDLTRAEKEEEEESKAGSSVI